MKLSKEMFAEIKYEYNHFKKILKIDPFQKTRKQPTPFLRAMFYKMLYCKGFNDKETEDIMFRLGYKVDRSTIYVSLSGLETNYKMNPAWRYYYDKFFSDFKEKYEPVHILNKKDDREKDKLDVLIDSISKENREEIYELVNLRVKSWEWKSKDRCEIIEGSSPLDGTW